jgi:hypothetical protein
MLRSYQPPVNITQKEKQLAVEILLWELLVVR